ncbi:TetR/AcrR family transcriptional regulator [Salinisphaera hydrothermalis]|uniref:HTH-type transcriptional regulator betI n=1 Tax=Salinisphaera hydrothermalis (strain C41B8) TaxID=1304275 RepID=A0A084IH74_SALHC|nr:TetR/AcrR family transcriptional regulator [Salinisphaera hydrothermalis]KEZ76058.1 HTH-type transcriptional regulator betI [Salinisphaera hydrothermalis C41B8]
MARPRNQGERRRQLIDAATEAVIQHGVTHARLADIADEAGLTPASVLYYYPDVRELFSAVFEHGHQEYCTRREARVAAERDPVAQLAACIRSGVPRPGQTEQASRVLYELMPVVLRNEQAAMHYRTFVERQAVLYRDVLDNGAARGVFQLAASADSLGRGFVALEDGYGVQVLIGGMTADDAERALFTQASVMAGVDAKAFGIAPQ